LKGIYRIEVGWGGKKEGRDLDTIPSRRGGKLVKGTTERGVYECTWTRKKMGSSEDCSRMQKKTKKKKCKNVNYCGTPSKSG